MQAKRKLTALLLSLCMVLSVLPTAVFAADDPLVGGSQETDPYEPQMIDKIELEVDAPAEGKPADFSIQSQESDPYTVNDVYWSKCADEGDENTLVSMSADDSFEKGWYRLVLYVYMDFNYAATEDIAVSLVGAQPERLVVDRELESTVVVDAWFAIDPPEKQEITRLAFDEIPVPAAGIDFGQAEDTIEKQVAQAHDEQVKIYSADYYEWSLDSYDDYHVWNTVYSGDEYDGSLAYGVRMLLYAQTGWYFGDTPPEVTVNGEKAKVISLDPYRIEVFMQFGDIVVDYIYIDSEIWPLEGQEIRMEPDNFTVGVDTLGAPAKSLFTIKDARMLIKPEGKGDWRDLTAEDTHFSTENDLYFLCRSRGGGRCGVRAGRRRNHPRRQRCDGYRITRREERNSVPRDRSQGLQESLCADDQVRRYGHDRLGNKGSQKRAFDDECAGAGRNNRRSHIRNPGR